MGGSNPERPGFGFAKAQQVALDGDRVLAGPKATGLGLREILRRAPRAARLEDLDAPAFERALAELYRDTGADSGPGEVSFDLGEADDRAGPQADLLEDASDAPVIRLVNQVLRRGVQMDASDLHFEPHERGLRVRARVDGFLVTLFDRDDVPVARVVSRLKVMAELDIAETRLPQDGRIAIRIGGRAIDTRVSTLHGAYGERVVLRILDRAAGLRPLSELGLPPARSQTLDRLAARPDGIVLATGPTGSGKTTTLYSLLKLANRDQRNLITVEDPIEYRIDGMNQTQINSEIGMTFAAGLRAALRQDPDVILVGEIRDQETAAIAGQAALTGHLVFSSLHANTAIGAIVRLRDLGAENYLIAATLRGVIAQRLLRVLCPACKTGSPPAPVGCEACNGSGYRGRIGVYDIVEIDDTLREAIDRNATETEMRALVAGRAPSLAEAAQALVEASVTDRAEVTRVLGDAP